MTANDTATRRVTTGIVLAVGLFAGSDSYSHIYTLARDHRQAIASAALLPLAGDGLIAAASSAMLVASRQGHDVPVLARVMLLAGIGATIAANVGYGLHAGLTGALLSVWPVAAYVGCMELLTWMRRNTGMHPAARPASAVAAADAPDELARRRLCGKPALLDAAGQAFPAAGAGNVPSLREIQRTLRIGQGKAQQVQVHLAGKGGTSIQTRTTAGSPTTAGSRSATPAPSSSTTAAARSTGPASAVTATSQPRTSPWCRIVAMIMATSVCPWSAAAHSAAQRSAFPHMVASDPSALRHRTS
jgi:hypothetical protein